MNNKNADLSPAEKKAKAIIFLVIVGLVIVFTFCASFFGNNTDGDTGNKTITVNIDHSESKDKSITINTDSEYLLGALQENRMVDGRERSMGFYVTIIDNEEADESEQEWWQYFVNGKEAVYAVDKQPISNGDVIDFKLNVGW